MITSNYTVNIIEPNEGFYLTKKDNKGQILSKKVFLAVNDSVENWIEISIEEGDKLHQEILDREKAEKESENNKIQDAVLD